MIGDEDFMAYCINAAKRAGKDTQKNPMVGSVLVHNNQIIGEGIHEKYGHAHAERNAIQQAVKKYPDLLSDATLYVTLEPCFHQGKTPPCVQLVLEHQIKKVVIGAIDPNPLVAGKSIALLKENGIQVEVGVLEKECLFLIRKFVANLNKKPYIILKWAQSSDGYMGQKDKQVWLSNKFSKILVHKWRSEVDGIMVGTQTVITDNPLLSTREWAGDSPVKIIPDFNNRIPIDANIYSTEAKTYMLRHSLSTSQDPNDILVAEEHKIDTYWDVIFERGINSIMVEGGQKLLKSIIKSNLWDEARIITTPNKLNQGISAPSVIGDFHQKQRLSGDLVVTILNDRS